MEGYSAERRTLKGKLRLLLKKLEDLLLVQERNNHLSREQRNEYVRDLSKHIFWDLIIEKLDCEEDKQTIIERIAVYGTDRDERLMYIIYPLKDIKKCLLNSDSLNEKTMRYFAFLLHLKEKDFKWFLRRHVEMTL